MRHTITINKFDGGWVTKVNSIHGKENQSPDCQNVVFDDEGAVGTRHGYTAVIGSAIGEADLLHSYQNNSGAELLIVRSTVYKKDGTELDAVTGSTDIFTAGVRVHAANAQNYVFLGNGTSEYKYNGTDFTKWGVPLVTTALITSLVSADSTLAGSAGAIDYNYRVAYINSTNVESPASEIKTFTITNTCSPVTISFDEIPASHGINYISVYRNDYLLETVEIGTASVTDSHEDLITARDETIDDSRPPNINIFLYYAGYIFGAEEDTTNLYYSEINSLEEWDTDNYFRVGDGDGMTIRGLAIFNNSLIIAKENGTGEGCVYILYMPDTDPDNWSLDKLDVSYGTVSPHVMCNFSNFIAMINKNGVYDLSSATLGKVDAFAISQDIEPTIQALVDSYIHNSVAIAYKNKVWISVAASGSTNNRIFQYDFDVTHKETGKGVWGNFTGMALKDLAIHDGALYGTDYLGNIFSIDVGYNDNGSAIDSYYRTMHIFGKKKHRENMKAWRALYITVACSGAWDLTVSWRGDFSSTMSNETIDLDPGGPVWGSAIWGTSTWGAELDQKIYKIPIGVVAKAIQIKFSTNTADQYFKVYSMSLQYTLRGYR